MTTLPPLLVAALLLVGPGLVLWALGGRGGVLHWSASPAVTVGLTAPLAQVFAWLSLPWSAPTALPALLALALVLGLLARLLPFHGPSGPRGRGPVLVVAPWLVLVLVVHSALAVRASGGLDRLNNSYDAIFHLSTVAFMRATGDASMLTGTAPMYSGSPQFYPTAFHALAVLVPGEPAVAANAMSLVLVPAAAMGAVGLAASVLPGRRSSTLRALVAVLAAGTVLVHRSPDAMGLVMGLWPNLLGAALLPAVIGTLVRAARFWPRDDLPTRVRILLQVALVALGATLAHPTTLFGLGIVLAAALLVTGAFALLDRAPWPRWALPIAAALLGAAMFAALSTTLLASMDLTGAPVGGTAGLLLDVIADRPRVAAVSRMLPVVAPWIALGAVGAVVALRRRSRIGAVALATYLLTVAVVVLGTSHLPVIGDLSNAWYGARERLVPLQMCAVTVLVAIGAQHLVRRLRTVGHAGAACALALVLALAAIAVTALPGRVPLLASLTTTDGGDAYVPYVSEREQRFIEESAARLPDSAVVLGDPMDGTSAYWSIGERHVVYPSLADPGSLDARRVGRYADQLGENAKVCGSMRSLGVTYLYRDEGAEGAGRFAPRQGDPFVGLRGIPPQYLTVVASDGPYVLYAVSLPC